MAAMLVVGHQAASPAQPNLDRMGVSAGKPRHTSTLPPRPASKYGAALAHWAAAGGKGEERGARRAGAWVGLGISPRTPAAPASRLAGRRAGPGSRLPSRSHR